MATRKTKDWRQTIGAFTDDEGMKEILREANTAPRTDPEHGRKQPSLILEKLQKAAINHRTPY